MSYVEDLRRELYAVGIRGRQRQRIVAEIEDHLACDPEADLGEPTAIAHQFADELGTRQARRAGLRAFAGLAVAGLMFGALFAAAGPQGPYASNVQTHPATLAYVGAALVLLGVQVAFVAGSLAAVRTFLVRSERVVAASEATVIVRRAAVGLAAGLVATAGLALLAVEWRGVPGWWTRLAFVSAGVGAVALILAAPAVRAGLRLRPVAPGGAGDIFSDVGWLVPSILRGRPWRLALVVAAGLALVIALAGVVQSDGPDGVARGLLEAAACLAGFAVLGPYLGLWAPRRA